MAEPTADIADKRECNESDNGDHFRARTAAYGQHAHLPSVEQGQGQQHREHRRLFHVRQTQRAIQDMPRHANILKSQPQSIYDLLVEMAEDDKMSDKHLRGQYAAEANNAIERILGIHRSRPHGDKHLRGEYAAEAILANDNTSFFEAQSRRRTRRIYVHGKTSRTTSDFNQAMGSVSAYDASHRDHKSNSSNRLIDSKT